MKYRLILEYESENDGQADVIDKALEIIRNVKSHGVRLVGYYPVSENPIHLVAKHLDDAGLQTIEDGVRQ